MKAAFFPPTDSPSTIGIVYQQRGGPYKNYFTIVNRDGAELLAPIGLDPQDRYGSNSGDITYTGTGYDVVWRTNSGMGSSDPSTQCNWVP